MSNISESIREAALSWPVCSPGVVEGHILNFAFSGPCDMSIGEMFESDETLARTFMLLVAEALE